MKEISILNANYIGMKNYAGSDTLSSLHFFAKSNFVGHAPRGLIILSEISFQA